MATKLELSQAAVFKFEGDEPGEKRCRKEPTDNRHKNKSWLQSPFLLTRLVYFRAALRHKFVFAIDAQRCAGARSRQTGLKISCSHSLNYFIVELSLFGSPRQPGFEGRGPNRPGESAWSQRGAAGHSGQRHRYQSND